MHEIVLLVILIRVIIKLVEESEGQTKTQPVRNFAEGKRIKQKRKGGFMFKAIFKRRIMNAEAIFRDHYIDVKAFYAHRFREIPCVYFIGELDITAAFAYVRKEHNADIVTVFQHNYFDHEAQAMFFNNTVFVLANDRMIEFAGNYCQVLYRSDQHIWAIAFVKELAAFRVKTAATAAAPTTVVGFARQTTDN